jgi:hypothetical protein
MKFRRLPSIKWIGYKQVHRAWQDIVMPIHVARSAIDHHTPLRGLYLSLLAFASSSTRRTACRERSIVRGDGDSVMAVSTWRPDTAAR